MSSGIYLFVLDELPSYVISAPLHLPAERHLLFPIGLAEVPGLRLNNRTEVKHPSLSQSLRPG
jgi:hypothetical protein